MEALLSILHDADIQTFRSGPRRAGISKLMKALEHEIATRAEIAAFRKWRRRNEKRLSHKATS